MSKFKKVTGSPSVFIIDSVGEHRGMHYHNFPLAAALSEFGLDVSLLSTSETIENEQLPLNIHVYGVFRGIYGKPNKYLRGIRYGLAPRTDCLTQLPAKTSNRTFPFLPGPSDRPIITTLVILFRHQDDQLST